MGRLDKIEPGGRYLVGGKLVDANGNAIKGSKEFDVESATKAEMEAEAERRGIEVKRSDGKEGEPLADDYRAALK